MKFKAWFECFAGCGVRYNLEDVVYRCERCGGLTVSRPASGLPMGGDLEFADELTLGRALSGRRAL